MSWIITLMMFFLPWNTAECPWMVATALMQDFKGKILNEQLKLNYVSCAKLSYSFECVAWLLRYYFCPFSSLSNSGIEANSSDIMLTSPLSVPQNKVSQTGLKHKSTWIWAFGHTSLRNSQFKIWFCFF